MAVPVAWDGLALGGSEVRALPKQQSLEAIKLRLHVSSTSELHVDFALLALKLDALLLDKTPLFLKFCPDCVASHRSCLVGEQTLQ